MKTSALIYLFILMITGCSEAAYNKVKKYKYTVCMVKTNCQYTNYYVVDGGIITFLSDDGHEYKSSSWRVKLN